MAVELILSGFFRSGTTVLWEAAWRANPQAEIFYEPCHEQLASQVQAFIDDGGQAHPLHQRALWTAYTRYPGLAEMLQETRSPNTLVPDIAAVERTLAIFDKYVERPTWLQVNRWGYLLPEVRHRSGLPYLHIMRSPSQVYDSMRRYHQRCGGAIARWLKTNAWPLVRGRAFALDRRFAELAERGVIPDQVVRARPGLDDRFMAVWLAENSAAVAAADGPGSMVCVYESIVAGPAAARTRIYERLGIDLALDETYTRNAGLMKDWRHDIERLRGFGNRFGVRDQVEPILQMATEATGDG